MVSSDRFWSTLLTLTDYFDGLKLIKNQLISLLSSRARCVVLIIGFKPIKLRYESCNLCYLAEVRLGMSSYSTLGG